jgi:hypothetical protein
VPHAPGKGRRGCLIGVWLERSVYDGAAMSPTRARAVSGLVTFLLAMGALVACDDGAATSTASASATGSGGGTSSTSTSSTSSSGEGGGPQGDPCAPIAIDPDVQQALPAKLVDTSLPVSSGKTIGVASGGDLQGAIDSANPGDVITLAAGASFTGPFTLPNKPGSEYIVIRTDAPDASFPSLGTRVAPADATKMAKLVAPDGLPAIKTSPGAHHFRFVGVEVAPVDANATIYELVAFGDGTAASLSDVPHHLIVDRSYVHGTPTGYTKRGVQLDCADCAVIDSYVSDCHAIGQDAQAVAGFDGPGPIKIVNDYLEGSGENVIFGGADPAVPDLVPSDIEIRRNHFKKPLSWKADDPTFAGNHWSVKNLLELKNAARVLVQCNVFENNWADAQVGFAILLTPRNQDGTAPWCGVSDVTIADNILRHSASGFNVSGEDDNNPSQETARVVITSNLVYDIDRAKFGGDGRGFQIITPNKPTLGLKIAHNTLIANGNAAMVMGDTSVVATGLIVRDNLWTHGDYGVFGSGKGEGTGALDFYAPGYAFDTNALIGYPMASYPANNLFPPTPADVGFVDDAGSDYALAVSSPFSGKGSDGKDIGAPVAEILVRTKGVAP